MAEAVAVAPALRRGAGKSDELDAELNARSVMHLPPPQLRRPRRDDGIHAGLRVPVTAREAINTERTKATNALTALLRTVDLRKDARRALTKHQNATVAAWRARNEDIATATARCEAIRLARRIDSCQKELADNRHENTELVQASRAANLLPEPRIGTINAAVVLTAWSHHGRIRSEAAFAAISGTCPIPASSGHTTLHRLDRGGDRQLNRALSSIVLTRMSHDVTTRADATRRRTRAAPPKRSAAASSDTSPASATVA